MTSSNPRGTQERNWFVWEKIRSCLYSEDGTFLTDNFHHTPMTTGSRFTWNNTRWEVTFSQWTFGLVPLTYRIRRLPCLPLSFHRPSPPNSSHPSNSSTTPPLSTPPTSEIRLHENDNS